MNPEALSRIVGVLVENAIKFTNEGYIEVRAEVEPDAVVVTVADTGIGINDDARSQLFEPFRQASEGVDRTEEGLGLGLTLVGQLVELMDGSISVESEPGAGTQFEVVLPRNRTNDSSAWPSSAPAPSHKSVV